MNGIMKQTAAMLIFAGENMRTLLFWNQWRPAKDAFRQLRSSCQSNQDFLLALTFSIRMNPLKVVSCCV